MNLDESLYDAVFKIANREHPYIKEPNVMFFYKVEKWQVVRALKALSLLLEEWSKNENA